MAFVDPFPNAAPALCDCHVTLTADAIGPAGYVAFARPLGLGRVVLVQAGPIASERQRLMDTLAAQRDVARGVAFVSLITPEATLEQLNLLGVRGMVLRVSAADSSDAGSMLIELSRRGVGRRRNWHVQIEAPATVLAALAPVMRDTDTPVVISHMAGAKAGLGLGQPGLDEVLDLLAAGRVWVKLSGITQVGTRQQAWRDALPIMRALIATNHEHLVWGSNWPHHGPDDGLLALLTEAAGDDGVLHRILVDNPKRLYDFPA